MHSGAASNYIGPSLRSKFVTFFVGLIVAQSYKGSMSHREEEATGEAQEAQAAVRVRVPERRQMAMVVQCPDDLVPAQHPARVVMAVVETLDLSRFSEPIKALEGVAGRDATDPRLLVGLWLYACIRGIGSARELARRCEESAGFRWMCGGVTVNHRLLSDFRSDHGAALDELFTQVIASLVDKELVSVSRVSQDGVRVRVSAGAGSFRREERLQKLLRESKQHVEELRRQLENPEYSAALSAKQRAAPNIPDSPVAAAVPRHAASTPAATFANALPGENCPPPRSLAPAPRPGSPGSPTPVPCPPTTRSLACTTHPVLPHGRCGNPTATGDSPSLRRTSSGTRRSPHTAAPTPAPIRSREYRRTPTTPPSTADRSRPGPPRPRAP